MLVAIDHVQLAAPIRKKAQKPASNQHPPRATAQDPVGNRLEFLEPAPQAAQLLR
ncbi:hypothetical protein [Streptomyces olivaceoviridis]|uniref:hypothetical protein n=1 Tax=Streptomyces olivaceoviridis TaxID=1921 RepID=UPI0036B6D5A7